VFVLKLKKQSFLNYYFSDKVYVWEWILSSLVLLYILLSYNYVDTKSLTAWSVNLWDVIYDGKFKEFFSYTAENLHDVTHEYMGSDVISILPMSVWNFPIWIAHRFFGKSVVKNSILMAWSKIGLMVFAYATSYFVYKITSKLTDDKNAPKWAAILTFASAGMMTSVGFSGQNDIYFVFFAVLSVYCLICNKEWLFILFAAISIAIKPFFLFAYIPLLLFLNKNIFIILIKVLGGLSLTIFNRLIFSSFPMYTESMSSGPSMLVLNNMFGIRQEVSQAPASIFIIVWCVICLYAYLKVPKNNESDKKYILFFTALTFVIINCFSHIEHYRFVMTAPFLMIFAVLNKKYLRLNLILTFIYQFAYTAVLGIQNSMFLSNEFRAGTVIDKFTNLDISSPEYLNVFDFFIKTEYSVYVLPLVLCVAAVYVVAVISVIIINSPIFNKKIELAETGVFEKYDHGILLLNCLSIVPIVVISQALAFLKI